jgi:hypothetical protein
MSTLEQMALFNTAPDFRHGGMDTSRDAAIDNRARRSRHSQLADDALYEAGPTGLTDFELSDRTGVKQTSIGKRRLDLLRQGRVCELVVNGQPVRRLAPSGASAAVWVHVAHLGRLP